ncbi:nuclear transport factor 2 family protein [Spirosoma sp. KCTC 42546]|uniref:nuclear transport factor 2 family protein n=1 Tax=Spirosoma sp. KCTC 42546 TaxID=2520506 RepID=UPI001159096F|nr:nuclear transport factor 2 family protein [Spirosoma sp. KCTC 42546]QDK77587.1 nuclear transport factor 2 family protein [Spirosoma sp. KCTC 42546]
MKTNQVTLVLAAFVALFLFAAGCNTPAKETATQTTDASAITPEQKQAIEKEISGLIKEFFQQVEKLDIEKCMTYFENTPDFQAVNPDGTFGDYNALKKLNADGFSQMKTLSVVPAKEAIRVLTDSLVLYTFSMEQNATLKTGQKMKFEHVAGTMLFTKINGAWKATFYQESAAAPVAVK